MTYIGQPLKGANMAEMLLYYTGSTFIGHSNPIILSSKTILLQNG